MVNIDIMALGNDFILEVNQPLVVRLEIARGFVKAAVDYINEKTKSRREAIFDNVTDYGDGYGMVMPDKVFESYVKLVNQMLRNSGWDNRLVIKLDYKGPTGLFTKATLVMDLEATAEKLGWEMNPSKLDKEDIMDKVSDTPSVDDLNEFNRLDVPGSGVEPSLSPNRRAEFVRKDTRTNIQNYRG